MSTLTTYLTGIADAIRAKKGTSSPISASNFATEIASISTGIERLITNDDSITPTGTYANSTYINMTYGVKIGYMYNGDIILSMRQGTTREEEKIYFQISTYSPREGVTINADNPANSSYISGQAGLTYACILSGITTSASISVTVDSISSTYDYVVVSIWVY